MEQEYLHLRTLGNNGSAVPMFGTDEPTRSYFVNEIPIHPGFVEDDIIPEGKKEELVERLVEGFVESQKR